MASNVSTVNAFLSRIFQWKLTWPLLDTHCARVVFESVCNYESALQKVALGKPQICTFTAEDKECQEMSKPESGGS